MQIAATLNHSGKDEQGRGSLPSDCTGQLVHHLGSRPLVCSKLLVVMGFLMLGHQINTDSGPRPCHRDEQD